MEGILIDSLLHHFDQRNVDIIDQVEYGVYDRLHIYSLGVIFYFRWHINQMEGANSF